MLNVGKKMWPISALFMELVGVAGFKGNFIRMSGDAEIKVARSAAAERMRLHRQRRREGLRCLLVELRETEIDTLVRRGLLKPETRNDTNALKIALYEHLDRSLGTTP